MSGLSGPRVLVVSFTTAVLTVALLPAVDLHMHAGLGWGARQPDDTNAPWTRSSGDGLRAGYVRFRANAGKLLPTYLAAGTWRMAFNVRLVKARLGRCGTPTRADVLRPPTRHDSGVRS